MTDAPTIERMFYMTRMIELCTKLCSVLFHGLYVMDRIWICFSNTLPT